MKQINWDEIQKLADRKMTPFTKTRKPFHIISTSKKVLTIRVHSGEEYTISRNNLEKAATKIKSGTILKKAKGLS